MCDIAGLSEVKSSKEANEAYLRVDLERLTFLKEKYGVEYAVLYREKNELKGILPIVFTNDQFVVITLKSL